MKKRSLFAAVAMLIVSAIVLTSATYAWFATGGPASISTISGKVATVSSGVLLGVNANDRKWGDTLDYKKLADSSLNNAFATNWAIDDNGTAVLANPSDTGAEGTGVYQPVSTDPSAAALTGTNAATPNFEAYNLVSGAFTANTSTDQMYDFYEFYVATLAEDDDTSTADTSVDVCLQIGGSAAKAARVAVFTYDKTGSTGAWAYQGVYASTYETDNSASSGAANWKPLISGLANGSIDTNSNYIVDAADTVAAASLRTSALATTKVGTTGGTKTVTFTLPAVHKQDGYTAPTEGAQLQDNTLVRVYVWLEGNDSDCAPNASGVPGGQIDVQWFFKLTSEANWT